MKTYETHNMSRSKLYVMRSRIITKCHNENSIYFSKFGGNNIHVCDEWMDSFLNFKEWANKNGYEESLVLHRKDRNKDFSPENCFFAKNTLTSNAKQTHGMSKTRQYRIRHTMIQRCYRENFKSYEQYGAKGITVCKEWRESFENFWEWASANGYEDNLTIDRINPNGNYEPSNCRWVTQHEQILSQEKNAGRTAEDLYLKFLPRGRFQVLIRKNNQDGKSIVFSKVCEDRDEATRERDYFLEHEKPIEHFQYLKVRKQKSLLPQNRIGHKILMLLLEKKWSVSDLATSMKVSRQAASQWIYTKREPRKVVPKIAELFGVSAHTILA